MSDHHEPRSGIEPPQIRGVARDGGLVGSPRTHDNMRIDPARCGSVADPVAIEGLRCRIPDEGRCRALGLEEVDRLMLVRRYYIGDVLSDMSAFLGPAPLPGTTQMRRRLGIRYGLRHRAAAGQDADPAAEAQSGEWCTPVSVTCPDTRTICCGERVWSAPKETRGVPSTVVPRDERAASPGSRRCATRERRWRCDAWSRDTARAAWLRSWSV